MRRVLRPGGQALFLEHVRPTNTAGRAVLRAIQPHTVAALDRVIRGLFLSLRATLVS